jgi:steroid delta-isomerase-like uncharacterized protein
MPQGIHESQVRLTLHPPIPWTMDSCLSGLLCPDSSPLLPLACSLIHRASYSVATFPGGSFLSETETNEQLVRRFFAEVWNGKDEAAIEEFLAPDCIAYGLPDPDAILHGPEEFKAVFRMFIGAFPDVKITVHDVIAAGDRVAVRWSSVGTHLGPDLGFPPSGKSIILDGATIGIVRGGRIAQAWNMMDMGHLFDSIRPQSRRE